jgi:hypothetical protein
MSLFLSAAFVVALAHPDLAHRRTIAELSGKGLWGYAEIRGKWDTL